MVHLHGPKSWGPLGLLRWMASGLVALFIVLFIEPLAEVNVHRLAEDRHWDNILVRVADTMPDLAFIRDSYWAWLVAGFCGGLACALWLQKWLGQQTERMIPHTEREKFIGETVFISDLVPRGGKLLAGRTFERCLIKGPAFLKPQNRNTFEFCCVALPSARQVITFPEGAPIGGAILLMRNLFKECLFDENIEFVGTPLETPDWIKNFDQVSISEWRQRLGSPA
jgi:hypothetical protein